MEMAIIILAAGQSKRMRGLDKLTQKVSGLPQIQRIALLACQVSTKVIVALPDAAHPRSICLLGLPIERRFILNSQSGMGYSLASAASMLKKSLHSGVMVIPADMPDLKREDIELLLAAHQKNPEVITQAISANGRLGHPVVFPNRCFKSLTSLQGDQGARALIAQDRKAIKHITLPGSHATNDLDTPEDWIAWRHESELRKK